MIPSVSPRHCLWIENARLPIVRANIPSPGQLLEKRSCGPTNILPLDIESQVVVLSRVTVRVLLVTPSAREIQPIYWRALIIRRERAARRVILVIIRAQRRIPQYALIRIVSQEALPRQVDNLQRVIMLSGNRIVCMAAVSHVVVRPPRRVLLQACVIKGLPVGVLAVPELAGLAVDKTHHVMLPVADVVAEVGFEEGDAVEDGAAVVKGVEVHVEDVGNVVVVVDNDGARYCGAALTSRVRPIAFEVRRQGGGKVEVFRGRQVDVTAVGAAWGGVELVEIVEGEG